MKFFNPEQRLTILGATDMQTVLDDGAVYDERNSARGSGSQLSAKYGSTSSGTPARETVVITSGNQAPQNNGFECPVPGAGDCFERIPREDISQVITANQSDTKSQISLDNVRGMHLCTMSGLLVLTDPNPMPTVPPTVKEQEQFFDQLFFFGAWSLRFRGQQVAEFKDRPLSELISEPGCCDAPLVHIGCRIPQYGGLEFELDLSQITIPNWVDNVNIAVRMRYSGCGCNQSAGCGCGCGSGVKGPNKYISKYEGGLGD